MKTLLLRLAGPLQSWGTDSTFEHRRSEPYPTKSGIIGLLAAALGRRRDEDIGDLAKLQIGIRVDQPGQIITDFHTARKDSKTAYITRREYLSDAVFLVGISGETDFLDLLEEALKSPEYPLFLGRRSCVPDQPIVLGLRDLDLKKALKTEPWQGFGNRKPSEMKIIMEDRNGDFIRRLIDQPVSFDFHHRKYASRIVSESYIDNPDREEKAEPDIPATEHDIMAELEDY